MRSCPLASSLMCKQSYQINKTDIHVDGKDYAIIHFVECKALRSANFFKRQFRLRLIFKTVSLKGPDQLSNYQIVQLAFMLFWWRFQKLKYDYQRARLSEIDIIIFRQMSHPSQVNVFFEEKHESTEHLLASRPSECPDSIPYLKKGDSNSYLDQFLIIKEEQPEVAEPSNKEESRQASVSNEQDEEYLADEQVKFGSSSFHNFQKHLTICLKHSIDIQTPQNPSQHHLAASKLWKAFKTSNFSTKKILHYLLGEKNEHRITQEGLQQYGFAKIYEAHDEKVMNEARRYLADCTLKQIKEGKLKEYLDGKKLKDKDRFRRYVEIFTNELSVGFLRKRLPKESVHYLQNS